MTLRLLLAVVCVAADASAQTAAPPSAGERPPWILEEFFLAPNAHPQERHEVQVTWTLDHRRDDDVGFTDVRVEVEYGITDRLQLDAEVPWQRRSPRGGSAASRWGHAEVGLLYAFARGPGRLLSAGIDVELPTGGVDLVGEDDSEVDPFVIVGHRLGRGEVQAALSYGLGDEHDFAYDVAAVGAFGPWRAILEMNGRNMAGVSTVQLTPGVMWKGLRGYEVGLAVPVGLHGAPRAGIVLLVDAEF